MFTLQDSDGGVNYDRRGALQGFVDIYIRRMIYKVFWKSIHYAYC
jgi:hypothetical protein